MKPIYTNEITVLKRAGFYNTAEDLVSDLSNVSMVYQMSNPNLVEVEENAGYLQRTDGGLTSNMAGLRSINYPLGQITFSTAPDSTTVLIYPYSSIETQRLKLQIDEAENDITLALRGLDLKSTPTLIKIATWLAAGYLMADEHGLGQEDENLKNNAVKTIEMAEKWLDMEVMRQKRPGGSAKVGEVLELSDEGVF